VKGIISGREYLQWEPRDNLEDLEHGINDKFQTFPERHSISFLQSLPPWTLCYFDRPAPGSIRLLGRDVDVFYDAPEDPIDDSLTYEFCRRAKGPLNAACGYWNLMKLEVKAWGNSQSIAET
jgi:hypothetical protein